MTFQARKDGFDVVTFLQAKLTHDMGRNTNREAVSPF